jgi:hypothetical protein
MHIGWVPFFIAGGVEIDYGIKHPYTENDAIAQLSLFHNLCRTDPCMIANLNASSCDQWNQYVDALAVQQSLCINICDWKMCSMDLSQVCVRTCIDTWDEYVRVLDQSAPDGRKKYVIGVILLSLGSLSVVIFCCSSCKEEQERQEREQISKIHAEQEIEQRSKIHAEQQRQKKTRAGHVHPTSSPLDVIVENPV